MAAVGEEETEQVSLPLPRHCYTITRRKKKTPGLRDQGNPLNLNVEGVG